MKNLVIASAALCILSNSVHAGQCGPHLKSFARAEAISNGFIQPQELPRVSKLGEDLLFASTVEEAESLIAQGADVKYFNPYNGTTALHPAVQYMGYQSELKKVAQILVTKGADINAKDYLGWSPLMKYIAYGDGTNYQEVISYVISIGAKVNDCDAANYSVLERAFDSLNAAPKTLQRLGEKQNLDQDDKEALESAKKILVNYPGLIELLKKSGAVE